MISILNVLWLVCMALLYVLPERHVKCVVHVLECSYNMLKHMSKLVCRVSMQDMHMYSVVLSLEKFLILKYRCQQKETYRHDTNKTPTYMYL